MTPTSLTALAPFSTPADTAGAQEQRPGQVQRIALALVWMAFATGSIVFSEPAPVDVLNLGLIALLPLTGLVRAAWPLWLMLAAWLVCATGGFLASAMSLDVDKSTTHSAISLYLYVAFFVFAGFVAKRPEKHTRLILDAWMWAALIAGVAGIAGYFHLFAGAGELFTKYDRASGPFKDPNVYGPFIVPALVYALHRVLNEKPAKALIPMLMVPILGVAILVSFSRGAWFNTAVGLGVYGYFSFVLAPSTTQRLRMLMLGGIVGMIGAAALLAAASIDGVGDTISNRAALTQSYDEGPDGRFGGQAKARGLILENPAGIGALEFGLHHHHEDVHNVYLSMFLNAGWLGGLMFAILMAVTSVWGLRHAMLRTPHHALFVIAYGAFLGNVLEGFIVDVDHWRHLYLLMAIVWGMMVADRLPVGERTAGPGRGSLVRQSPRRTEAPVARRGRLVAAASATQRVR